MPVCSAVGSRMNGPRLPATLTRVWHHDGRMVTMPMSGARRMAASHSCSPNTLASAYGSCGVSGEHSSTGQCGGLVGISGKKKPTVVSDEMFTTDLTPQRTHASSTLNVDMRLFWNTTWFGSGMAAMWTTASGRWNDTSANTSPALHRSATTNLGSPGMGVSKLTRPAWSVATTSHPAAWNLATAHVPTLPRAPVIRTQRPMARRARE